MSQARYRSRLRFRSVRILALLATVIAILLMLEGVSSLLMSFKQTSGRRAPTDSYYTVDETRRHARYDEELGWVSIPDLEIPDLYGRGKHLRTDSRGFRGSDEIAATVPAGKIRVMCSGDSFTFGQGVANDKTWCHLLSEIDPRLETVNMGQRGYGVDQAYLWYRRDGASLDHQVHLFAFIDADFSRMILDTHHGYGKPVLRLRGGQLTTSNQPVPRVRRSRPVTGRVKELVSRLRMVQLGRWLGTKTLSATSGGRDVAISVFGALADLNRTKDSRLVLVWLPVREELRGDEMKRRAWLGSWAPGAGLPFVDLTPAMRREGERARSFFIAGDDDRYIDAAGHYSEAGHRWVAEALYAHLVDSPETRHLFAPRPADAAAE